MAFDSTRGLGPLTGAARDGVADDEMDWSPGGLVFIVDEREWLRITPRDVAPSGAWVFDEPQYLLLNMAIGGDYPASVNHQPQGLPSVTKRAIEAGGVRTLVDWIQVTANRQPAARIEAETADQLIGVTTGPTSDGGVTTGSIARGDKMRFDQVDFATGSRGVRLRAASYPPTGQSGQVELRADRPDAKPFAIVPIGNTGGWNNYSTVSAPATAPTGVHTVYVTFVSSEPWEFVNLDWLQFDAPPQSLRGYWPMNEQEGPAVADPSGRTGPGVLHGGATRTADVHTGQGRALHFDGRTGYAQTAAPVIRTDQSFTVSAWVRLAKSDGYYTAVAQDGCRWTHLAGVYDAAAGIATLYVDGVADATVGSVRARAWSAQGGLTIGRSKYDGVPANFWPGDIDDVRVLAGTLTPEQIANLGHHTPA